MRMFTLVSAVVISLTMVGCSTKEREANDHALTDELEMIDKAEEAVELIESRGIDQLTDSVDGLE